jgi:phage-related protein
MAGRSVGRIEVTVDANTKRLKAQLTSAGTSAGKAAKESIEEQLDDITATVDFNSADLRAETAEARQQIEAQLRGLAIEGGVELDVTQARAQLRELEAYAEAQRLAIEVELSQADLARINAQLRTLTEEHRAAEIDFTANLDQVNLNIEQLLAEQRQGEIDFQVELNTALALAEGEAFRAEIESLEAAIQVKADLHDAALEVLGFKEATEADVIQQKIALDIQADRLRADKAAMEAIMGELNIPLDVELAVAEAEMLAWRKREAADAVNVRVDVDRASMDGVNKRMHAAGSGAGDSFLDGFSNRLKLIAGAVILLTEPAAVALEATLGGAVALTSSAFSGLSAAVVGLGPALASLTTTIGTLSVGLQGVGDATEAVTKEFAAALAEGRSFNLQAEDIQKAMAALAPAARDFVTAFAEIKPQLHGIQQVVQQNLFQGLDESLLRLSDTAIPAIGDGLADTAKQFNEFFRNLADLAAEVDFAGIFEGLAPITDAMLRAFEALFQVIEPFLKAAAPAAQELAKSFQATTESLLGMVQAGAASGGLSDFLMEGVESLRQWWDLTRAVGDALFTLMEAGQATGDSMIESLTEIIERFDEWMESAEGQTALAQFFETSQRALAALVPLLKGAVGFFDNLVTEGAIQRFEDLAESLGEILPVLGSVFELVGRARILNTMVEAVSRLGDVLEIAMPALQDLADVIGTNLAAALEAIEPLIEPLGEAVRVTAEAFAERLGTILPPVVQALGALAEALVPVIEAITPLIPLAVNLAAPMEVLAPFIQLVAEAIQALTPIVEAAVVPLELFADLVGVVTAPIRAVGDGIGWLAGQVGRLTPELEGSVDPLIGITDWSNFATSEFIGLAGAVDFVKGKMEAWRAEVLEKLEPVAEGLSNIKTAFDFRDAVEDLDPLVIAMHGLAEEADAAAESADLLKEAWDRLFGGAMELSEATDAFAVILLKIGERQEEQAERLGDAAKAQNDYADAVDEAKLAQQELDANTDPEKTEALTAARDEANRALAESKTAMEKANKAANENLFAIKGNTEAALENRDMIRDGVDVAIAIAAAKVREGATWEQAARSVNKQKEALLDQLEQQGYNREAAEAYIETLNLTPENIRTAIELANQEAAQQGLRDYDFTIEKMDGKGVTTPVMVSGLKAVMAGLDGIIGTTDDINRKTAKLAVGTEGVPTTQAELDDVIAKANELDGKVATVTVNTVFQQEQGLRANLGANILAQHGGRIGPGWGLAGEAGAEFLRFGSLRRLVTSPTLVPPGTVVTSAALTAALLRANKQQPAKQIYNTINVAPRAADPGLVAEQIVNRAAVLAR